MPQADGTTEAAPNNYSMNFYYLFSLLRQGRKRQDVPLCTSDTLGRGKNFWKEMRNLGLIPETSDALHGFMPDKLNAHLYSIFISFSENPAESFNLFSSSHSD